MRSSLLIAPAMDGGMYDHSATQENIETLKTRGATFIGPAEGHLASGLSGVGRMLETAEILGHIRVLLGRNGPLNGKKVLITAGGTQEPIDPVRVITNRSSGKQGYALAQAALEMGAQVTLITTPTALTPPVGAHIINVETAKQMLESVLAESVNSDALIMAAAVADFRPKDRAKDKIKKEGGIPQIMLEATEDILKTVAGQRRRPERVEGSREECPRVVVGFAAESRDLLENAAHKLKSKGLDFIAANDISASGAGFAVDTNRVTLLFADGRREALPLMNKTEVAEVILGWVSKLLESYAHSGNL
jgi:phosphopantothenoylcysteine decarboxylase/phosphopantothenate--cysteine ligase